MEEKKKDSGFVVKDKRYFGESAEEKPPEAAAPAAGDEQQESKESSQPAPDKEMNYPSVNFTNFILSLSTSALFHFGDFPETEGGKPQKNLPAAKQTIDILDLLHEKTKGNLDKNESELLQGILYELKMRYVKEKA
ncbi:MAG: DUF1844 domain-containing protein [Smithella sp.]